MNPELRGYLDWLLGHGIRFEVATDLVHEGDHDGPLIEGDDGIWPIELPGIPPFVEHRDPEQGLAADHATCSLARALLPRTDLGARFWDIGCGTGVLAVAAGLKGASAIVATDLDARAITLARRTAADANISIRFVEGALLDAVPATLKADVVAANLPHKPCPPGGALPLGQRGGLDGSEVHEAFAAQATARLEPGALVGFWLHSLPAPRLFKAYELFDLELVSWKRRFLQPGEYADILPYFLDRAEQGTSWIGEARDRRFLVGGTWLARRR